ncbi:VRR-NUC domain-containing protein [Methylobacterium komagatae]
MVSYLRSTLPHAWMVHHSPNGSLLPSQRRKSAELGTVPGWPDIEIVGQLEGQRFIGFMEVKAPHGRISEEQIACGDRLMDCGCEVVVIRSVEDARKAVSDWGLPSKDALITRRSA